LKRLGNRSLAGGRKLGKRVLYLYHRGGLTLSSKDKKGEAKLSVERKKLYPIK